MALTKFWFVPESPGGYLKGETGWSFPEAVVFETGGNRWHTHDQWPPKGLVRKKLYFRAEGKLSFDPPEESNARDHDSYLSDPDKPVPYTTAIRTDQGHEYLVEDQRFAATRPDVLVYESGVLTEDVTIAGPAPVRLFVSTSGTDSDWIVKLIDVFPGDAPPNDRGTQMGDFQMLVARHGHAREVSQQSHHARTHGSGPGHAPRVRPARPLSHFLERPPHHGSGAKHLVPTWSIAIPRRSWISTTLKSPTFRKQRNGCTARLPTPSHLLLQIRQ